MGRSRGRQHCSSLCSQSEGHGYGAKSGANSLIYKIVNDRPCLPAQHSSPSLCKQSELQCCASCLASLPILFFLDFKHPPQGFTKSRPYQCKYLPARSTKTKKTKRQNEAPKQKSETNKAQQRTKKAPRQVAGLFILKDFIAFPSVWRGGKNVDINTLGS